MDFVPCYKKSMESEYPILRSILLDVDIPDVYRQILLKPDTTVGMMHALTILSMLSPSRKNNAFQQMAHRSSDRRWKNQFGQQSHPSTKWEGPRFTAGTDADWQRRQWDIPTLLALCTLPVRRLVTDGTESGAFNMVRLCNFVGMKSLSGLANVDIVRALLATVPVSVLCSEMCSLHDRMSNPPFLDSTLHSVGLLHYFAAMIASRHAFFAAGMPDMRPHPRDGDEQGPCNRCLEAIMKRVQGEQLIHVGLLHALMVHDIFTTARGGWSVFDLLKCCASTNITMRSALDEELWRCGLCRGLVLARGRDEAFAGLPLTTYSLVQKMIHLIEGHGVDISKLIEPYNVVVFDRDEPDVMGAIQTLQKRGMLMDFVQDVYMQDNQLGTKLALLNS